MAGFVHVKGGVHIEMMRKKASTVIAIGDIVYADGSGAIQPGDATSGNHLGISQKAIAATDSDYASNTRIPVIVPHDDAEFEVPVGTGTLTTADEGNFYDLKDANEIDQSATSKKVILVTKFLSATKARVKINAMAANKNVETS